MADKTGNVVIATEKVGEITSGEKSSLVFRVKATLNGDPLSGTYGACTLNSKGVGDITINIGSSKSITGLPDKTKYTISINSGSSNWDSISTAEKNFDDYYDSRSWDVEPTDKSISGGTTPTSVTYTCTYSRRQLVANMVRYVSATPSKQAQDYCPARLLVIQHSRTSPIDTEANTTGVAANKIIYIRRSSDSPDITKIKVLQISNDHLRSGYRFYIKDHAVPVYVKRNKTLDESFASYYEPRE